MPFGLIAGAAAGLLRKAAPKLIKAGAAAIGLAKKYPATAATVGATAVGAVASRSGPSMPPPPPTYAPSRGPAGPVTRFVQRMVPGGKTGRELTPYEGTEYDKIGRPIAVHAEMIERTYVPPGYVVVDMPDGQRIGVLRNVARSMGLWKPRPKPPITAGDARAIRRANGARKRVKRLAGAVGFSCNVRGRGGSRRKGKKC